MDCSIVDHFEHGIFLLAVSHIAVVVVVVVAFSSFVCNVQLSEPHVSFHLTFCAEKHGTEF